MTEDKLRESLKVDIDLDIDRVTVRCGLWKKECNQEAENSK